MADDCHLSDGMQPQGSWLVLLSALSVLTVFLKSSVSSFLLCPQMVRIIASHGRSVSVPIAITYCYV